ncbi:hypothetical protein MJH12_17790, partial [bacterium]|nr:hypothetical protein [bacterium]
IVVEVINPKGLSGAPLVYDLLIRKVTNIAGAFGSNYGADHALIESVRLLKQSALEYPTLLAEKSFNDSDLKSSDVYKITSTNTVMGSSYFAIVNDPETGIAFEKVLAYSDIIDSPFGQIAIESIFNSQTSSYETVIEGDTVSYGVFEGLTIMEPITKLDGKYDFISYADGYFYMIGQTLDNYHVLLETPDFVNFNAYFLLDENSGLNTDSESTFLSYDEDSNSMLMGIRSGQRAQLYQLDLNSPGTEPTILFTQDLSRNNSSAFFNDFEAKFLNGSNFYGFFAAYYLNSKLYLGLNLSDFQLGGMIVEAQNAPFSNQSIDDNGGLNLAYFKPFIGSPQNQFFQRFVPGVIVEMHSNATKSIVKQNGRVFRLDFTDNLIEVLEDRQKPVIVREEQRSDVAQRVVKGFDPFDFHLEIIDLAPNYARMDQALVLGLIDESIAYYDFNSMKIYPCHNLGKYRELTANLDASSTLVSSDSGRIYMIDKNASEAFCDLSLQYTIPQTVFDSMDFRFTEAGVNELYVSYSNKIVHFDRLSQQKTEIMSFLNNDQASSLTYVNDQLYYLKGVNFLQNSIKNLYHLDPDSLVETLIQDSVQKFYKKDGNLILLTDGRIFTYDLQNKSFELDFIFQGGNSNRSYDQHNFLSDINAFEVSSMAASTSQNVAYFAQNFGGNSQIKRIDLESFSAPVITGFQATHDGDSNVLVAGDKITFTVSIGADEAVAINSRYNGKKLDFKRVNSGIHEAQYLVNSRSVPSSEALSLVGVRALNQYGEISNLVNINIQGLPQISPTYVAQSDLILQDVSYSETSTGIFLFTLSVTNHSHTTVTDVLFQFSTIEGYHEESTSNVFQAHDFQSLTYTLNSTTAFPGISNFHPATHGLRIGVIPRVGATNEFYDVTGEDNYYSTSEYTIPIDE